MQVMTECGQGTYLRSHPKVVLHADRLGGVKISQEGWAC